MESLKNNTKKLGGRKDQNIEMYNELNKMYNHQYLNEQCSCFYKCSIGMESYSCGHRFSKLKLGTNYGNNDKLKIMFIGKEAASDQKGSFEISEPGDLNGVRDNNIHYFGTIYTAAYLLSDEKPDCETINKSSLMKYNEYRHDFCLTNYFKCAFKKEEKEGKYHDIETNLQMKKNCAKILLNEIDILKPDIVVFQGKFSHSSFYNKKEGLASKYKHVEEKVFKNNEITCNISVSCYERKDKTRFCVIWSYHPCAHGNKWNKTLPEFQKALDFALDKINKNGANLITL